VSDNEIPETGDHSIEAGGFVVLSAEVTVPSDSDLDINSMLTGGSVLGPSTLPIGAGHVPALESQLKGMATGESGQIEFSDGGAGQPVTSVSEVTSEPMAEALESVGIQTAWGLLTANIDDLNETLILDEARFSALQADIRDHLSQRKLIEFTIVEYYRWSEGKSSRLHDSAEQVQDDRNGKRYDLDIGPCIERIGLRWEQGKNTVSVKAGSGQESTTTDPPSVLIGSPGVDRQTQKIDVEINGETHTIYPGVTDQYGNENFDPDQGILIDQYTIDLAALSSSAPPRQGSRHLVLGSVDVGCSSA